MLDFTIYIDHVIQASRHDIIVKKRDDSHLDCRYSSV